MKKLGKKVKATIEFYETTLTLDSSFVYLSLGKIYYEIKDYNKAIWNLNKFIEFDPSDLKGFFFLGSTYHVINDFNNASNFTIKH